MPGDERLFDLLERWEELERAGLSIAIAELCADAPELQPEVERAIAKLRKVDSQLNLSVSGAAEPGSASRSSPWPWVSKSAAAAAKSTPLPEAVPADEEVPVTWKPGDEILGLYDVREVFTGGGRGLVYRVRHRSW